MNSLRQSRQRRCGSDGIATSFTVIIAKGCDEVPLLSRERHAAVPFAMEDFGMSEPGPEERGREALRRYARTWLHGARSSALEYFPLEVTTRLDAINAMERCVAGLLAPLNALCAVDDEAAEALGVLLYKANKAPLAE